jgi:hypothetical protein
MEENAGVPMCLAQGVFRHLRLIAHSHVLEMRLKSAVGLTLVPKFGGHQTFRTLERSCEWILTGNVGAGNRLSVYSTASVAPAAPEHVLTASPYTRLGCYTEGNGTRALSGAQEINYTSMTVEKCSTFCDVGSYTVMGVEFGGECYCGSKISFAASGSTLAPDTDCNMLCGGSSEEFCGAGNRLDTYHIAA